MGYTIVLKLRTIVENIYFTQNLWNYLNVCFSHPTRDLTPANYLQNPVSQISECLKSQGDAKYDTK